MNRLKTADATPAIKNMLLGSLITMIFTSNLFTIAAVELLKR